MERYTPMPADRIEALTEILAHNPNDSLARYGLAMEHIKTGRFEEAVAQFEILLTAAPDHAYACFHAGQTLEKLGRPDDARAMYLRGIEAAARQGNSHARDEIQTALEALE
jgi:Flp pilus assembly protein TadD